MTGRGEPDQHGRPIDVGGNLRLGQVSYAYIDGTCQGWLPRGEVDVDVARGFEYEPLHRRLTIAPGQRRLERPFREAIAALRARLGSEFA